MNAQSVPVSAPVPSLTLLSAPDHIGKRFSLVQDATGRVRTDKAPNNPFVSSGWLETTPVPTATAFAALLCGLKGNQALVLGLMRDGIERTRLTVAGRERPGYLARTRANFVFSDGPTWILIDIDVKDMPADVRARVEALGGLFPALLTIWPELASAGYLIRPSSSAGIHREGDEPDPAGSLHVYVLVKRGTDIPTAIKTLHQRAMVAGLGWAMVDKVGRTHDRSLVDETVGQPERISYEGAPLCGPGVFRTVPETIVHDGPAIDAPVEPVPGYDAAWFHERAKVTDKAAEVRKGKITTTASEIAAKRGIPLTEARKIAEQRIADGILDDDATMFTREGPQRLGDMLDSGYPHWFCDPHDPNPREPTKARISYRNGKPDHVYSFKHGGKCYRLARNGVTAQPAPAEWVEPAVTVELVPGFYGYLCGNAPRHEAKPGKEAEALYLVSSQLVADAVHEATGCEVIALDKVDAALSALDVGQRAVVAMVEPGRRFDNVRAIAGYAAEAGGNVWVVEAPSPHDEPATVLALLKKAQPWQDDPTPWLNLDRDPEVEARRIARLSDQVEQAKAGAALLNREVRAVVDNATATAKARAAIKALYRANPALSDIEAETLTDVDRLAIQRERARAIRAGKAEITAEHGLDKAPKTRGKRGAGRRIAITSSQGIGKTAALVGREGQPGSLHSAHGAASVIAFPTKDKAREAFEEYSGNVPTDGPAPVPVQLMGRTAINPADGQPMCVTPELAEAVGKSGANVQKALCLECPFAATCAYQRQFKTIEEARASDKGVVVFTTHDRLTHPIRGLGDADIVCIDESPLQAMRARASMSLDTLGRDLPMPIKARLPMLVKGVPVPDESAVEAAALQVAHDESFAPVANVIRAGFREGRTLAALRDAGMTADDLATARKVADAYVEAAGKREIPRIMAGTKDDARKRGAEHAKRIKGQSPAAAWVVILDALADELDRRPDCDNAASVWYVPGKDEVCAVKFKPLAYDDAAVILTDGTANLTLVEPVLGQLREVSIKVSRRLDVTQVVGSSFSKSALVGNVSEKDAGTARNTRRDIVAMVERIAAKEGDPKKVVVVAQKDVIRQLRADGLKALGVRTVHFGNLRGMNKFERCTAAVIIGRNMPSPRQLEDEARPWLALYNRDVIAAPNGPLTGADVEHTTVNGDRRTIATPRHPDELVEAVRWQICEAELLQAVDRLRPIFCDGTKRVHILGHHVVLPVDRFAVWSDVREGGTVWQRMAERGFIPNTPGAAFRLYPELFGTDRTARIHYATAAGEMRKDSNIESIIGEIPDISPLPVTFRPEPSEATPRPREVTGLCLASDAIEARAIVERLAGPLRSFAVVEQPRPVAAAEPVSVPIDPPEPESLPAAFPVPFLRIPPMVRVELPVMLRMTEANLAAVIGRVLPKRHTEQFAKLAEMSRKMVA